MPWEKNPPSWKKPHTACKKVGFHPTFSRHGIAQILSALALLIWLNEKVPRRLPQRGAVEESSHAVEESSPAVEAFFHGIYFLRLAALPKIDAT